MEFKRLVRYAVLGIIIGLTLGVILAVKILSWLH